MTPSAEIVLEERTFRFMLLYRWASLAPAVLLILLSPAPADAYPRLFLALGLAMLDNLVLTVFRQRLNHLVTSRPAFIGVDLVFSAVLIALTGGWQSPYYLYALSPLLGAAFFVGMRGALAAATAFAILYLAALVVDIRWFGDSIHVGLVSTQLASFFLVASLFGYPAVLLQRLRQARDALAESHRELESLHRLALTMQSSAVTVSDVQEQILTSVTGTLGFERAMMAIADAQGRVLFGWLTHHRAQADYAPDGLFHTAEIPLHDDAGAIAQALLERQAVLVADGKPPTADPVVNSQLGLTHYAVLPMIMRDRPLGVLIVDNPDTGAAISDRDLASLAAIADQAAIVLGSTQMCIDRTRRLAVEAERNRIALDIHDAVSQSLFGTVFTLDACIKLLPEQAAVVQERLTELRSVMFNVMTEVRRSIFDLWGGDLSEKAFEAELYAYLRELAPPPTLHVSIDVSGHFDTLDRATRKQLYRLAQEALSNLVRHADATLAHVQLELRNNQACLTVEDNGRGFDLAAVLEPGTATDHLGLTAMRERARGLSGSVEIQSTPGRGTRVVVVVPQQRLRDG